MNPEILKLASTQGVWATLSIFLIFYILKAQEKRDQKQDDRESEYQKIIVTLTEKFEITRTILDQLSDLRSNLK